MLDRLYALETFGIKLGLENISRLCAALGHPERSFRPIHIAGTNGKGSVAAMVHAALVRAGVRTGRYTSPHLTDIAERFVVHEQQVSLPELERVIGRVLDCADDLRARGELRVPPTFFEAATASAFDLFREHQLDVGVIEVGLGGRFDATNVVTAQLGAITSIGFDHQQHLGETLGEIAFEKAGIIKPGMTMVTGEMPPEAMRVIEGVAAERGAHVVHAAGATTVTAEMVDGSPRLTIVTTRDHYGPVTLGLRGEHQISNALVTVRLLEAARDQGVPVSREHIVHGLANPEWPARLELLAVAGGGRVLLDAAHNIDGASALAGYLRRWHPERPPLVFGVMHDKDVDPMLRALIPFVSSLTATAARTPRAMPADELARRAAQIAAEVTGGGEAFPISVEPDPDTAVEQALRRAPLVCVAGSIFLAGAVRQGLRQRALHR